MVAKEAHTPAGHSAGGHLDRQLFHGIAWTAVLRWIGQAISWLGTLYAAHVLLPADYGLVAMAMLPIGLLGMVDDLGLDSVLVQDRSLGEEQIARIAGLVLLLGAVLVGAMIIASRPIAVFFREPLVGPLISILSVKFLFDALQIVPRAQLQRELKFTVLAALAATQFLVASLTLVISAKAGFGYWALVLNTLMSGLVITAILIWLRPFRVAWPRDPASLSRSIKSGWRLLVTRAAWYGYINADQTVIGRVLNKDALGAYSFAMSLSGLPIQELSSIASRVVPGVFSAVQQNIAELRRYFLLLTEALAYLTFPAAVGLALTADRVVHIVLGPRWEMVIEPFRILCLYQVSYAAQVLISHVLTWTGHFRAGMWLSILGFVGLVAGYLVGVRSGIVGVAWSLAIMYPLLTPPALIIAARIIKMRVREFFGALVPATISCLMMSAAVVVVRYRWTGAMPDGTALAFEASIGAMVYCITLLMLFRGRVTRIVAVVLGRGAE